MRLLARAMALVLAVAVLAGAAWSLVAGPPRRAASLAADELPVGDGVARVDAVIAAAAPMGAMPGMGTDPDPVPEGLRRVSVELTVRAPEGEALPLGADGFALAADGVEPVAAHRAVLPSDDLPPGAQVSGVLVFEVPEGAAAGDLAYDGGAPLPLELPAEDGRTAPHGGGTGAGGGHPTSTAASPAPAAGPGGG
ncbi:hypothetical protein WDV85_04980 [Pseudokineococcus sp. 5B2Z-1]|uniref:hypothetical protein n=1 Tax=Pseudokineococcus sp. 5B2Z-1 TaxID=3132744 RepID=UPI0030A99095